MLEHPISNGPKMSDDSDNFNFVERSGSRTRLSVEIHTPARAKPEKGLKNEFPIDNENILIWHRFMTRKTEIRRKQEIRNVLCK